jgi:hypothetical protein
MKCDECEVNKAAYRCPECGAKYCDECADLCNFECDCQHPPRLEKIKKNNGNKR